LYSCFGPAGKAGKVVIAVLLNHLKRAHQIG
jgi:hypothetical protein